MLDDYTYTHPPNVTDITGFKPSETIVDLKEELEHNIVYLLKVKPDVNITLEYKGSDSGYFCDSQDLDYKKFIEKAQKTGVYVRFIRKNYVSYSNPNERLEFYHYGDDNKVVEFRSRLAPGQQLFSHILIRTDFLQKNFDVFPTLVPKATPVPENTQVPEAKPVPNSFLGRMKETFSFGTKSTGGKKSIKRNNIRGSKSKLRRRSSVRRKKTTRRKHN